MQRILFAVYLAAKSSPQLLFFRRQIDTAPTIGMNQEAVKYKTLKMNVVDMGGRESVRLSSLWPAATVSGGVGCSNLFRFSRHRNSAADAPSVLDHLLYLHSSILLLPPEEPIGIFHSPPRQLCSRGFSFFLVLTRLFHFIALSEFALNSAPLLAIPLNYSPPARKEIRPAFRCLLLTCVYVCFVAV